MIRLVRAAAVCAILVARGAAAQQKPPATPPKKPASMPGMAGMPGMAKSPDSSSAKSRGKTKATRDTMPAGMTMAMPMPIPMPAGMPMIPGLTGMTPDVTSFVPGMGRDPKTVPAAKPTQMVRLKDGDTLDLTATLVRQTIKKHSFAMYGFNGQIPGPMLRVPQNATVTIRFHNRIDLASTVHWHGVRLDNRFDGVPGMTQDSVAPGGDFVYTVHFPDAGVYWYHPHVREDIEQAMGLAGNMLVDSPDSGYYSPANREQVLMLGDVLINADTLVAFGKEEPTFALMGRVGNIPLVNGEPRYALAVKRGEVVRFYLTNVSSSRTFNVSFGGAPIKVVASDVSRFEREERVPSVVLAPAERYVVEVRFDRPGRYTVVNAIQAINHYAGEFSPEVDTLGGSHHQRRRGDAGLCVVVCHAARQRRRLTRHREVPLVFSTRRRTRRCHSPSRRRRRRLRPAQFMNVDTAYFAPVEWVDGMPDMNWLSTSRQVRWILRDAATRGRRTWTLTGAPRAASVDQAPDLQRSEIVSPDAASDSPARPAHARRVARRRGDEESRLEGHGDHSRRLDGRSALGRIESGRVDAALSHRRAPRLGDDDRAARRVMLLVGTHCRGPALHRQDH